MIHIALACRTLDLYRSILHNNLFSTHQTANFTSLGILYFFKICPETFFFLSFQTTRSNLYVKK